MGILASSRTISNDDKEVVVDIPQHAVDRYCERVLGIEDSADIAPRTEEVEEIIFEEVTKSLFVKYITIKDLAINVDRKHWGSDRYGLFQNRLYCCAYHTKGGVLKVATLIIVSPTEVKQLCESNSGTLRGALLPTRASWHLFPPNQA